MKQIFVILVFLAGTAVLCSYSQPSSRRILNEVASSKLDAHVTKKPDVASSPLVKGAAEKKKKQPEVASSPSVTEAPKKKKKQAKVPSSPPVKGASKKKRQASKKKKKTTKKPKVASSPKGAPKKNVASSPKAIPKKNNPKVASSPKGGPMKNPKVAFPPKRAPMKNPKIASSPKGAPMQSPKVASSPKGAPMQSPKIVPSPKGAPMQSPKVASSPNGAPIQSPKVAFSPPKAKKVKHVMEKFGDIRIDNYYWLRDDTRSNPEVLAYLQEENKYTNLSMSDTKYLHDKILAEIDGRTKKEDISPVPGPQSSLKIAGPMKAGGELGNPPKPSPNNKLLVMGEDNKGDEIYTYLIIDVASQKPIGKPLVNVSKEVVWMNDETLIYTTKDAARRQDKVWLHKLGDEQSKDLCLYHEKDDKFNVGALMTESSKFALVLSASKTTSFFYYLDVAKPEKGIMPLTPRVDGAMTMNANHRGNHFFIMRKTKQLYNSEIVACPVTNVSACEVVVPHRESVKIDDSKLFANHLVLLELENGLYKVEIYNLPPVEEPLQKLQRPRTLNITEPTYYLKLNEAKFSSSILKYTFTSLKTPLTFIHYDMNNETTVKSTVAEEVLGYDPSNYVTRREWVTAQDGVRVPISMVYKKDLVKFDGSNPLLLDGYGAYEEISPAGFLASRLSLLDRGFIYAMAHVRGGGEMGRMWYENGKFLKKKNTFTDFISCAEYLINNKYTKKEKLSIMGGSAGGLLVGAVVNMRPDLFKAAVALVPFLDVLTTMLDPTIPLTTSEYEEWGNPDKEEFYRYIKSYSPVDNISAQKYPAMLVTAGLLDPRVLYSEPAKFVAKLREMKTDDNLLLFKTDFEAGHLAKTEKSSSLEDALIYTFILKALNMTQ